MNGYSKREESEPFRTFFGRPNIDDEKQLSGRIEAFDKREFSGNRAP